MVRQLLISSYTRLDDRDLFAEILDVHLKDRRKTMVSRLDLHGQITFGDTAVMRGPAYDKTAVGEVSNDQKMITADPLAEQKALEEAKSADAIVNTFMCFIRYRHAFKLLLGLPIKI